MSFSRPREGFTLNLQHFLTSSPFKRSKFWEKAGCESRIADILMEIVQSYDDLLRAMSPPRPTKVAAQQEPKGGYLTLA